MLNIHETFFKNAIQKMKSDQFNQKLFKAFILAGGTTRLADHLNAKGYKTVKGIKYLGKDLKEFLLNPDNHIGIEEVILNIVIDIITNKTQGSFEQRLESAIIKEYEKINGEFWYYSDKSLSELLPNIF